MYDAFNKYSSDNGDPLEYWDIGFLSVFDNNAKAFTEGAIAKLFENLPKGISVGNPTFSQNSPYIVSFDYFDEFTSDMKLVNANLETGKSNIVFDSERTANPSFGKDDKKLFINRTVNDVTTIGYIPLGNDKISSAGDFVALYTNAKWPVAYADGNRTLGLAPLAQFTVSSKVNSVNAEIIFSDLSLNNPTSWQWIFEGAFPKVSTERNPKVKYSNSGVYPVKLIVKNNFGTDSLLKENYISVLLSDEVEEPVSDVLKIFPNPVNVYLSVVYPDVFINSTFRILDIAGKTVLNGTFEGSKISVSEIKKGVYIFELRKGTHLERQVFVKE